MNTTWRNELSDEMDRHGDSSPSEFHISPSADVLDVVFDAGYGGTEGEPFLAWTADRVYFPVCYDGSEWVGSAPRNPMPEGQEHVGGG